MNLENSTCVICCCTCPLNLNPLSSQKSLISQTICKIFMIQQEGDFECLLDCCPNCSSQILEIQKILQILDEAKSHLEQIVLKNAAGNFILDQNTTAEIARNEIIKRITPSFANPVSVNIKLEEDIDGLNQVLDDVFNDPDWNMSDSDSDDDQEVEQTFESEKSNLDHIKQFNLKTPVLKIIKLPQSLVNQLTTTTEKNIDLKAIQNEINLHLQKDKQTQSITRKRGKSSIVKKKKKFACTKCNCSYKLMKVLKEHDYMKHGAGATYKPNCPVCKKSYSNSNNLKSHIHLKHPSIDWFKIRHNYKNLDRNFKCTHCKRKFFKKETMQEHEDRQHPQCVYCQRVFCSPVAHMEHVKNKHTKEFPEICHVCGRGFASIYLLKQHLTSHEKSKSKIAKKFDCDKCSEVFFDYDSLWFHKRKHKKVQIVKNEKGQEVKNKKVENYGKEKDSWFCELCGTCLASEYNYKCHMRVMHGVGESKYSCIPCKLEFYTKQDMKRHNGRLSHKLKVNGGTSLVTSSEGIRELTKEFKCTFDNCTKTFNAKPSLRNHIVAFHHKEFPCEFCAKNLSSETALSNHIKDRHKSDDELNFPCSQCTRRFFDESRLHVHLKWHEKKVKLAAAQVSFKCDICSKEIKSQQSFKIHLRMHSGEKPYSCSFCDRSFHIKQLLKNHEQARHSDVKNFQCTVCNKSFKLMRYLSRHRLSSPGCKL